MKQKLILKASFQTNNELHIWRKTWTKESFKYLFIKYCIYIAYSKYFLRYMTRCSKQEISSTLKWPTFKSLLGIGAHKKTKQKKTDYNQIQILRKYPGRTCRTIPSVLNRPGQVQYHTSTEHCHLSQPAQKGITSDRLFSVLWSVLHGFAQQYI